MRALVVLFLLFSGAAPAKSCKQYEMLSQYLDTKKFIQASKEARVNKIEPLLQLGDINQAKVVALRFPAFKDLGFGLPGSTGWRRYESRLEKSALKGKNVGWEIKNENGFARVRIDYDPIKGAHYNIEISEKKLGKSETHKLAIGFSCGNKACTEAQVLRMVEHMQ